MLGRQYTKEQYRAWNAVWRALQRGDLKRPDTCEHCGKAPGLNKRGRSKIEAHHYKGYDAAHILDVIFLCSECHKRYNALIDQATCGY